MLEAFRELKPLSRLLFFAPAAVGLATDVLHHHFCVARYVVAPSRGLTDSLIVVVASCAVLQFDRESSSRLAGKDPAFGTEFLTLLFMSAVINGMIYAPAGLIYLLLRIVAGSPC